MVRSYLRHEPTAAFGVVCSNAARSVLDADGKTAYVAALEDVLVWDVRRGEQLAMWHETGQRSPVTALSRCAAPTALNLFAVGHEDGSVRIWDADTNAAILTFHGHRRAITALAFDPQGMRLASASQDTTVILWDLVSETGLYRLKGHRDAITDLAFLEQPSAESGPSTSAVPDVPDDRSGNANYLLSTAKDGLLKLWDLSLQHCVETVVPGKGELWSVAALPGQPQSGEDSLVLTGSAEGEVRAWALSAEALAAGLEALTSNPATGNETTVASRLFQPVGQVEVASKRRVTQMSFGGGTPSSPAYLALSSSDRSVQVFRIREEEEMRKKMARRKRRQKEKERDKGGKAPNGKADNADGDAYGDEEEEAVTWVDRIVSHTIVRPESGRIRSFAWPSKTADRSRRQGQSGAVPLLCATNANSLEVYNVPAPPKNKAEKKSAGVEPQLSCSLDLPGHRSAVRALGMSSDDSLLASADSQSSLKIWNVKTGRCIRTMPCGYALTLSWLPGDRYVIVGCKDGSIITYDVPAGEVVESIQKAHDGPVWSIALHPNGMQCVSASADKNVKFWEFEMRATGDNVANGNDEENDDKEAEEGAPQRPAARQQLGLAHTRTLKMTDDVLFARFSPRDGRLLALSLLDNTVKVFYSDSLKFFLSLYGHKLPVLSLDISGDDKLCVTCSADKNVKIWGLDYGDCHRSLFAHQDSIMSVAFERGVQGGGLMGGREGDSHRFWTIGKDGLVKHWDGDRFELIQTLEGHHGEVWSLTVGARGDKLITSGADRSMRVWEKTDEPLFLEEEREREQEQLFEAADREARDREEGQVGAVGSLAGGAGNAGANGEEVQQQEASAVTNTTGQTLMSGEKIIEALDLADEDRAQRREWVKMGRRGPPPPRNALILASLPEDAKTSQDDKENEGDQVAERYVLMTLERILPAQLDDALLTLPFDKVVSLLRYLDLFLRPNIESDGKGAGGTSYHVPLPLVSRILFFLLRQHHSQIVSNSVMRSTLVELRRNLSTILKREKAVVGYNLTSLRYIQSQDIARRTARLYERGGFSAFGMDEGEEEEKMEEKLEEEGGGPKRKRKGIVGT
ncbi:unnamed protein product [Jaminaea pallidilutea]